MSRRVELRVHLRAVQPVHLTRHHLPRVRVQRRRRPRSRRGEQRRGERGIVRRGEPLRRHRQVLVREHQTPQLVVEAVHVEAAAAAVELPVERPGGRAAPRPGRTARTGRRGEHVHQHRHPSVVPPRARRARGRHGVRVPPRNHRNELGDEEVVREGRVRRGGVVAKDGKVRHDRLDSPRRRILERGFNLAGPSSEVLAQPDPSRRGPVLAVLRREHRVHVQLRP
mmetsp:Transcript_4984/g.20539  ORF Transcript_4984/g.20539 Transcript_4984/m.20539 type:complete len:225 (-) Transcript_4984:1684-2358(-)